MVKRLEVKFKDEFYDARGDYVKRKIKEYFKMPVEDVKKIDVFTIDADLTDEQFEKVKKEIFLDPVTQISSYEPLAQNFDYLIEVGFLPGVKDNVGATSIDAIEDLLKIKLKQGEFVYKSAQYLIKGKTSKENAEKIAKELLANELIEYWKVMDYNTWKKEGMEITIPKVEIPHKPSVREENLDLSDEELVKLSKNRSLALSLGDMHTIRDYFRKKEVIEERKKVGLGEKATDIELEVIAQTQSEHCKHRIFNAFIKYSENGNIEEINSLFNTYVKKSSKEIEEKKDWIVSTFWDNAGVVKFNDEYNYIVKCETHNSPSALDPYGGAITGIVGVYRDPMGTGKGSKIIAGTYGYCTADPFYNGNLKPRMHPRRLLEGIIEGVKDGGNKSGIPTPYGLTFFDDCWIGKPLVYVAAIGIAPSKVNGKLSHEKKLDSGDLLVMAGGRVGKDGIHGVTEASLEHGAWITAGHVQIGDPFTQKKMHDFLLEARDKEMYKLITDNGGGGLSSSIGETSRMSNGCEVYLDKVPLKYAGLDPWEIMLSESQERMTLGVEPKKLEELKKLAEKHDVEMTVIGEYKDSGKFHVLYKGKTIAYMDMDFLHGGFPQLRMEAEWNPMLEEEPKIENFDHTSTLRKMLSRVNIASKEWIERMYDHEVQGGSVIKPFLGEKNDGPSNAAVIKPVLELNQGLAISAGINPKYSKIDAYYMAACSLDEAIRKVISVGGSLDQIALNDNFCWPNTIYDSKTNPDGKQKLAQLVRANKALYDYTTYFGTPCVSGKDSMFIDSNLKDTEGKTHKISGLPTLQFTAVAKVNDVSKCISMDVKRPGDLVYVIGETRDELGASEFYEMFGYVGKNVPKLDKETALEVYQKVADAIQKGLIASCYGCYKGGLGIALIQKAFAGGYALEIDLKKVPGNLDEDFKILYSESPGRFVITTSLDMKQDFEKAMEGVSFAEIGEVSENKNLVIKGISGDKIIDHDIYDYKKAWQETFKGF